MAYPIPNIPTIKGIEVEGVKGVLFEGNGTFDKVIETLEGCKEGFKRHESPVFNNNGHNQKIIVESVPIQQGYHSLKITQVNVNTNTKRNIHLLVVSNCHSNE